MRQRCQAELAVGCLETKIVYFPIRVLCGRPLCTTGCMLHKMMMKGFGLLNWIEKTVIHVYMHWYKYKLVMHTKALSLLE